MRLQRDVAPGIHRVEDAYTNWYLVEDGGGELLAVDAGVRTSWDSLRRAMSDLGRSPADIAAVLLTHAHFDHIGFAERARSELGTEVWVHEDDVPLTQHPLQYSHERSRIPYLLNPRALPIMASLLRARAFWPPAIAEVRRFQPQAELPLPGGPRPLATPGHTVGHTAFHFPDRDAVIAGDAIVTLDPYTGGTGPQIVSGAATADSTRNLESLHAIAETDAAVLLPGHGEPWTGGAAQAVAMARAAGPS